MYHISRIQRIDDVSLSALCILLVLLSFRKVLVLEDSPYLADQIASP